MKKLLRGKNDETQLTFRYPVAVSSSIGLLHGFGFAAFLVIRPALKRLLLAQDQAVHWM